MGNIWKRMEGLIAELLRRDDLSSDERFGALLMAMDAARLPRTPEQVRLMRRFWQQAVDARPAHRRKP
jgi:hypothetical protein